MRFGKLPTRSQLCTVSINPTVLVATGNARATGQEFMQLRKVRPTGHVSHQRRRIEIDHGFASPVASRLASSSSLNSRSQSLSL